MYKLTKRQKQVADLVSTGAISKKVADQLNITEAAVKFHLTNLYKKYDVLNRSEFLLKYNSTEPTTTMQTSDILPTGRDQ